jgi:hypothetical protein
MSQAAKTIRRVRFEEVNEYAAFLDCSISPLGLPIFDGYDDLDDLRLAFFTIENYVSRREMNSRKSKAICKLIDRIYQ